MLHPKSFLAALLLVVPAVAAPLDRLQDTFGGASIDASRWTVKLQSYGTASESGGTLNLVPDANTGSSLIIVSSASTYSLAGSQAAVKASSVPSTAGNVDVQFSLLIDSQNYLQWYCESGFLYAFWAKSGVRTQVARLDYAAAAHAWWRIRESGGTAYWETSADGAVYSVQASVSTSSLFAISSLQANFFLETYGAGLAKPGQASFANFNVAPSGITAVSSFVDKFGDASLSPSWTVRLQSQGTIAESGGSLSLAPAANSGSSQLMVSSARPYALTGSAAFVQAKQVVSDGGNVNNSFLLQIDGSNKLEWWFEAGTLYAFYTVNGVRTTAAALPYDRVQHAWWRIREDLGIVYWETAPDGGNWTPRGSAPAWSLFSLSMLFAGFYAETWGAGSPAPGAAQYATFNYARYFVVTGFPASVTAFLPLTVIVEVRETPGSRVADYAGTVTFSSSDANATLPAPYTFTSVNAGFQPYYGVVFRTPGDQGWSATDGALTSFGSLTVVPHTTPPVATVSPGTGSVLAGVAEIRPTCTGDVPLVSCSLAIDGVVVATAGAVPPLTPYNWDTRTASDGLHALQVTAKDTSGLTGTTTEMVQVLNSPASHDLVWNGSFEKHGYPQSFAQSNDSGSLTVATPAYDGSVAAGIPGGQWLSQVIWIPAGAPITLSFWYRGALGAGATPSTSWQDMSVRDRSGATLITPLHVTAATAGWQQVTADLSAWAGSSVELRFSAAGSATLDVDAVSLVAAPDAVGNAAPCLVGGNMFLLDGSPGDYIHPGTETLTAGVWHSNTMAEATGTTRVEVGVRAPDYRWWWTAQFAMRPIVAGSVYEGATRAAFTRYGPGLDVSGTGRGCNQVAGRYAVRELSVDGAGKLKRFTATFEQSCETFLPVLRGCVHWEAP